MFIAFFLYAGGGDTGHVESQRGYGGSIFDNLEYGGGWGGGGRVAIRYANYTDDGLGYGSFLLLFYYNGEVVVIFFCVCFCLELI